MLAVFKMLFFRPKDLLDIEQMLMVQGGAFDRAFVRAALLELVGPDDERVREWDQLCRRT